MHSRDFPDSLNGLGIPGNNWFHRVAATDIRLRLKKSKRKQYKHKLDVKLLNDANIQSFYAVSVRNKYAAMLNDQGEDTEDSEIMFNFLKEVINKTNEEMLPRFVQEPNLPWMTQEIILLMDKRRGYKGRNLLPLKRQIVIENSDSTIATEVKEVKWSEYIRELFYDDRPDEFNLEFDENSIQFNLEF